MLSPTTQRGSDMTQTPSMGRQLNDYTGYLTPVEEEKEKKKD